MDQRLRQLEAARMSISVFCRRLSWVFLLCFVLYCFLFALIAFMAIFPPEGFRYVGPSSILTYLPLACNVISGGFALFVVAQMLKVVGKGASPFTLSFARQIKVLAIVLLVGVIAGALIDPGTQVGSVSESGSFAFESIGDEKHSAYIDVKCLFVSIICFAFSPIFRYGALLQSEADDLM